MTTHYEVDYSDEALRDLQSIYEYIAYDLQTLRVAFDQVARIRQNIRNLDTFPTRHQAVNWEPWRSIGMRQMPVDNFMVFYTMEEEECKVHVVRIFYGRQNVQGHVEK